MLQLVQLGPIIGPLVAVLLGAFALLLMGLTRLLLAAVGVRVLRGLGLPDDLVEKYTMGVLRPFRRDRPK